VEGEDAQHVETLPRISAMKCLISTKDRESHPSNVPGKKSWNYGRQHTAFWKAETHLGYQSHPRPQIQKTDLADVDIVNHHSASCGLDNAVQSQD
jgi:hypothetical protein